MIKITVNSAIACALFLYSSTMAVAGSPYNLNIPAPGSQFRPHAANPSLRQKPVINRSLGHVQRPAVSIRKYIAITNSRARRQGAVSAGGVQWQCKGNRCTTKAAWARPTVQTCKVLAGAVGAIQSYRTRGAGLIARDIRSCNAGIIIARAHKMPKAVSINHGLAARAPTIAPHSPVRDIAGLPYKPLVTHAPPARGGFAPKAGNRNVLRVPPRRQGGFAPKQASNDGSPPRSSSPKPHTGGGFAPSSATRGTTSGGSSPATSHPGGGFAGRVHVGNVNVLSPQQLAQIEGRRNFWEEYKRAMEEKRRRDEAALQARIHRLSHEAYISGADCNDNDPDIRPDLLEVCDGKDNNCDGRIDEGVTILSYRDADGDGHGDPATAEPVCASDITAAQSRGEWLSTIGNDCNDADPDHWHDCPAAGSSR